MHAYMYSSLYTCNCTVLYSSFYSENKNVNVSVNVTTVKLIPWIIITIIDHEESY